ncbi:MAG: phosphodiester glycosidase family protein [Acidobacteriota bacterium]|nr:phosphodiester glycosidase family protein [Acidobacteriota bacterium]
MARRADARRRLRRRQIRRRRLIWGAIVPLSLFVLYFGISYADYMLKPTSMTFAERSAEWVRNAVPFGNWIIDTAEHYTASAPRKGGPGLKHLRSVGVGAALPAGSHAGHASYTPPPIKPVFATPLPGEGVWRRTGPTVAGRAPVLVTTYRPSTTYPAITAYVLWIDHTRTDLAYYPGRYEPPSAAARGPMMVPVDQRSRLLATFNSGFTHVDTNNGSAVNGHTNEPLIDGNATLVGYRDGRVNIVKWSGGPNAPANIAWARQSLTPILWNGKLNPQLNTDPNSVQWGYTLGGVTFTPRTGVGVDAHGNVMFVIASQATVISLAQILQHIGAVRGMEFDINPEWHTLITYSHRHGLDPTMVEPQYQQSPNRYLTPDDRDFMAVFTRKPGPVTVPFK